MNNKLFWYIPALFLFLGVFPLHAAEMPKSLDYYSEKGIEVEFIELQDPLLVKLKLPDGKAMHIEHIDKDFEALHALQNKQEKTGKKLIYLLKYTNKEGPQIYVPQSKRYFKILGSIENHPIDIALQECFSEFYSTSGMIRCEQLALDAWDAELNRVYKALGGGKNTSLKKAQIAWVKYRDAQTEALRKEFGTREGTIWGVILMGYIVDITKTQANVLKTMNSKSL